MGRGETGWRRRRSWERRGLSPGGLWGGEAAAALCLPQPKMAACSPCVRVSLGGASLKGAPHLCQLHVTDPPPAAEGGGEGGRPRARRSGLSVPPRAEPRSAARGGGCRPGAAPPAPSGLTQHG